VSLSRASSLAPSCRMTSMAGAGALQVFFQVIRHDDGIVVLLVLGAVNERHARGAFERLAQPGEPRLVGANLGQVTLLELGPFLRIVAKPLAQIRTRREILRPVMNLRIFLLH